MWATEGPSPGRRFDAVLFDRDGTLVHDVPYNRDPDRVDPVPGARAALDRLRDAGLRLGVVTNQSAIGRGTATPDEVSRVNHRVEDLLGPFDTWQVCPHEPFDGCACRKPEPGLVLAAAAALGVATPRCVVVGDIGADMAAAAAAGAAGILVPTDVTRLGEVAAAPAVAADLAGAVDLILGGTGPADRPAEPAAPGAHVLAVRADSAGDVLLCGPAIRAIAARAGKLTLLCGPRGRAAAALLPGIDEIVEWAMPWIDASAPPVRPAGVRELVDRLASRAVDQAVVFTSFHQSPLPFALLLRMAGVGHISAISEDWPGSLLDVRHHVPDGVPEPERALSLAAAAGYPAPAGAEPRLAVRHRQVDRDPRRVVVHPGASVPARAAPPELCERIVAALAGRAYRVLVTGSPAERELTARVAGAHGTDLGGRTDLAELADLLAGCGALVVGNTGPAHLAAAVGTPVVSLYAPTVPFGQWGPYGVPHVRLGWASAPCAGTRATRCPVAGHPCLARIEPDQVVAAVDTLTGVVA